MRAATADLRAARIDRDDRDARSAPRGPSRSRPARTRSTAHARLFPAEGV
jgi:hypothetical protein